MLLGALEKLSYPLGKIVVHHESLTKAMMEPDEEAQELDEVGKHGRMLHRKVHVRLSFKVDQGLKKCCSRLLVESG